MVSHRKQFTSILWFSQSFYMDDAVWQNPKQCWFGSLAVNGRTNIVHFVVIILRSHFGLDFVGSKTTKNTRKILCRNDISRVRQNEK